MNGVKLLRIKLKDRGYVFVSDDGQIYPDNVQWNNVTNNAIRIPQRTTNGYLRITYGSHDFKVHRVVAMAFLDDYSEDLQVDHINGVKTDNRVCNLRMVTPKENVLRYLELKERSIPTDDLVRFVFSKYNYKESEIDSMVLEMKNSLNILRRYARGVSISVESEKKTRRPSTGR